MAWANKGATPGQAGAANSKTAGTTLVVTTTNTAGTNVCIFVIALDNTSTTDGNTSEVSSISDVNGNTWVKAREFCNGQGAAAAGATVSVWYSQITSLLTSQNVTINFTNSITAKAAIGNNFSIGAGNTISILSPQDLANDGVDPGSMTISGLTSQEYLFYRGIAIETAGGAVASATGTYTNAASSGQLQGTAGGSDVTNMSAFGEFRIFTGTGDTSDPTIAAKDSASVYVAFKEVVPVAFIAQPNKPILQAVNRAATY